MKSAVTAREKWLRDRRGGGKWLEDRKKILNRGNELKDLLKTNDLASFRAKNKPKTDSILSAKRANQREKNRAQESGFRWRSLSKSREAKQLGAGVYKREQQQLSTRFVTLDPRLSTSRLGKLNERSGNVYENKGPLWKTCEQSLNLTEKKGVRCLRLEFLLKTPHVRCTS
jgi:hypothetical protein